MTWARTAGLLMEASEERSRLAEEAEASSASRGAEFMEAIGSEDLMVITADVALTNLAKVQAYIESIAAPNGTDPRGLTGVKILAGPALFPRVVQLTNAKILAQAAASGGGSKPGILGGKGHVGNQRNSDFGFGATAVTNGAGKGVVGQLKSPFDLGAVPSEAGDVHLTRSFVNV